MNAMLSDLTDAFNYARHLAARKDGDVYLYTKLHTFTYFVTDAPHAALDWKIDAVIHADGSTLDATHLASTGGTRS